MHPLVHRAQPRLGAQPAGLSRLREDERARFLGQPAAGDQIAVHGLEVAVLVVEGRELVGQPGAAPGAGGAGHVVERPPVRLGELFGGQFGADEADDLAHRRAAPVADGLGGQLPGAVLLNGHGGVLRRV
ncbi:hypothetical protein [Streptomyces niveus]|uniref:hypothetical protein n=1 Tax=Streptomyces niveus TaxID=193462 RepID=UPI001495CBF2|nr:hypothetical protein [Streptomyces niveus]